MRSARGIGDETSRGAGNAKRTAIRVAFLGVCLSLALVACAGIGEQATAFSEAEHRAYFVKGSAAIAGEGFIRRPNGALARCSGLEVTLAPQSPYFKEWVAHVRAKERIPDSEALSAKHRAGLRVTQCDLTGRFQFTDLPAGKWYVSTAIGYASDRDPFATDSLFVTEVETKPGETAFVVLSNPNRI